MSCMVPALLARSRVNMPEVQVSPTRPTQAVHAHKCKGKTVHHCCAALIACTCASRWHRMAVSCHNTIWDPHC